MFYHCKTLKIIFNPKRKITPKSTAFYYLPQSVDSAQRFQLLLNFEVNLPRWPMLHLCHNKLFKCEFIVPLLTKVTSLKSFYLLITSSIDLNDVQSWEPHTGAKWKARYRENRKKPTDEHRHVGDLASFTTWPRCVRVTTGLKQASKTGHINQFTLRDGSTRIRKRWKPQRGTETDEFRHSWRLLLSHRP